MSKDAICNHCGQRWTATEVEDATPDEIPHFWERVEPGDVMPLGICPACEGLCLPLWGSAYTASQQVVALCEGLAQLLEWSEQMGGWDAPCWDRARELLSLCARQDLDEGEPAFKCRPSVMRVSAAVKEGAESLAQSNTKRNEAADSLMMAGPAQ